MKKVVVFGSGIILIALLALVLKLTLTSKIPTENFQAPGKDWPSSKKVADYFIEHMRVKPEDAIEMSKNGVEFRLSKISTLQGIISNLTYYGLVRDENSLSYALKNTKDTTPGRNGSVKVGNSGTIDLEASYELDTNMTTWEVADILLNKPIHWDNSTRYDYLFMPGNPHSPTREKSTN
jgi:hypothetical protein